MKKKKRVGLLVSEVHVDRNGGIARARNEFLREYKRIYSVLPNKNLLKALIRTASSFALKYDNVDAVMDDPKHLLKATAELEDVYGNRSEDEKASLQNLADNIDAQIKRDPELNRIYEKRKKALKRLRRRI